MPSTSVSNPSKSLLSDLVCIVGLYFQLLTGCRPSEAAFLIMTENSFQENDYPDFKDCDWKATVPAAYTKTGIEYKWGIPKQANGAVELL